MLRILIMLLCIGNSFAHAQQVVQVDPTQNHNLFGAVEYLVAPNDPSLAEVLDHRLQDQFQPLDQYLIPAIAKPVWLRFYLANPTAERLDLVVNFDELLFDEIAFFADYRNPEKIYRSGLNYDLDSRPIRYRFFAFPLQLEPYEQRAIYVRVFSSNMAIIAPHVSSQLGFVQAAAGSSNINIMLIGMATGLSMLFIVFLPAAMHGRESWGFIAYMISNTLLMVAISGDLVMLLELSPAWHKYALTLTLIIATISNITLLSAYFELKERHQRSYRVYVFLIFVFLALALIYPFAGGYEGIIMLVYGFSTPIWVVLLSTAIKQWREGFEGAGLFVIGLLAYLFAVIYIVLGAQGIVIYDPIMRHMAALGLIIQSLVFSAAVARKLHHLRVSAQNLEKDISVEKLSNAEKSKFLATMSHEIRTPVNGVIGMAQMLELTEQSADQKSYTNIILDSGNTLLAIINDILDLSKIEAGRMQLQSSAFNLDELMEKTNALFTMQAGQKGLEFSYEISENCPRLLSGDIVRIMQVLNNLLSNALKFTDFGFINVYVSGQLLSEHRVRINFSVNDSGIGISSNDQRNLFKAFRQADSTMTRNYGGTGLGLSISKKLVQLMDGNISLSSEHGKGTQVDFYIELGLASEDEVAQSGFKFSGGQNLLRLQTSNSGHYILVAEDNKVNQQVICSILSRWKLPYLLASDGVEAVALYKQYAGKIMGVLMDCEMPNLDGLGATEQIRLFELEERKDPVSILALTAHVLAENQQQCFDAGMDAVLNKPINFAELREKMEECFKGLVTEPSAQ